MGLEVVKIGNSKWNWRSLWIEDADATGGV